MMKPAMYVLRCVTCVLIIGLLLACNREDKRNTILPPDIVLQAGDVVFRQGIGATSRVVRMADDNGVYSHVGLVVDMGDSLMIIHAVPGEPDYEGDYDRVKINTPEQFYSLQYAASGEVRRLHNADAAIIECATYYAKQAYKHGVAFDHNYDDEDTTKLYCCELIERAFLLSGFSISDNKRHDLFCPGIGYISCILPSDILRSSYLESYSKFN